MIIALQIVLIAIGFAIAYTKGRKSETGHAELDAILSRARKVVERLRAGSFADAFQQTASLGEAVQDAASKTVTAQPLQASGKLKHLLTREDVEIQFEESSWQNLAYQEFKTTILGKGSDRKTFPCVYATMGYRANDHRYVFLESDNPSEPRNIRLIAPALKEYLDISETLGPNTSLVIVGAPSITMKSVQEYNNSFWDMLRGLRIRDTEPWPLDIPLDTSSEKWTFCFDGQPVFPVMLTPAHQRRWSRHMSVPVIALQPKWVLDKLLSTPEKRESAVGKVRKLLSLYDQVDISPDLTSYGQPGTSEIKQLCLMEENETAECPYWDFDK